MEVDKNIKKQNTKIHKKPITKRKMTIGVHEPHRKTMYDVLIENFKVAERHTFIHRLIYFGQHYYSTEQATVDPIVTFFKNLIQKTNEDDFVFEKLTGFLLYYPRYFIHLLEGDENGLNRHVKVLLREENKTRIGKVKLFTVLSHVNGRLTPDWTFYFGIPRNIAFALDPDMPLGNIGAYMNQCVTRVYKLIIELQGNISSQIQVRSRSGTESTLSVDPNVRSKEFRRENLVPESLVSMASGIDSVRRDPLKRFLPETELLELFLRSDFPVDLEVYANTYGSIIEKDIYKDLVWPIPHDFITYDIFEANYKRVTEFPKTDHSTVSFTSRSDMGKREEDEDAHEEEESKQTHKETESETDEGFGSNPDVEKY